MFFSPSLSTFFALSLLFFVMAKQMPQMGMECCIIPRLCTQGQVISASTVRQAIHDGKLWAVINGSGLVEIMDAATLKHIKYIEIPTPRDIAFCGDYAYVTSWSGAYYGGENRLGAVYRIDINSLSEAGSIDVGYQPEGIAAAEGKIYVANSGGVTDGYDNRLSIIDEASFTLERNVEIAANICDIAVDGRGLLWISWITRS